MESDSFVNGILILDKPVGISSNQALQRVKRLFGAKKAGHTGALDVLASGLLPICLGEATKFSQFLLDADKCYRSVAYLGKRTTTCDSEGDVIETKSIDSLDETKIDAALSEFRGEIEQIPSMFSALKHKGAPLYKLARRGIEIERKPRKVTIYRLEKIGRKDHELTLEVCCSKGAYIRNLVDDIGKALGCGAYVLSLRRLSAGPYQASQMMSLEELEASSDQDRLSCLLPIQSMFPHLPKIVLDQKEAQALRYGQTVHVASRSTAPTQVQLIELPNHFFGIGVLSGNTLQPKRLLKIIES